MYAMTLVGLWVAEEFPIFSGFLCYAFDNYHYINLPSPLTKSRLLETMPLIWEPAPAYFYSPLSPF